MKTKIIPFDLETAKKIQAGEIEGKIKTKEGKSVRIICWDKKSLFHNITIVALIDNEQIEELYFYTERGEHGIDPCPMLDLVLEIPEEAPKHEFKAGDKVRIHCEGDQYDNKIGEVVDVLSNVLHVRVKALPFPYKINEVEFIAHGRVDNSVNSELSKHEFKPFDKVLIRENEGQVWHCDFYSYTDSVHGMHYCVGHCGNQILPYEGNEHFVGTTDKPKED